MTECIHGLDQELCDLCTPRVAPEVIAAPVVRGTAATRTTPTRRATARVPGAARKVAPEVLPDIDLASLRVHHWTHVTNLEGILHDGRIRADAAPELDVASAESREARGGVALPESDATVAGAVPFALSPDAATWDEVRTGAEGARWSTAARGTKATDFVILVAPVTALGDDFVVADGDPTAPLTRFAEGLADGGSLVRRASISDPDLLNVEILVPGGFDLSGVTLIGVPNDKARDRVKALIKQADLALRVAVYPPWFRATEV